MTKSQVDRLGERLKAERISEQDLRLLDEYRRSFVGTYEEVILRIRDELRLEPTGRPAKSTTALTEKLLRETARLSQIQDIAGCRVIVADMVAQDRVVAQLAAMFRGCVVVDRRSKPSYGYRAVHVIAKHDDKAIEIQIRTDVQHRWAELSEKLADVVDPAIKYGGGKAEIVGLLRELSDLIAEIEDLESELPILYAEDEPDRQRQHERIQAQKQRIAQMLESAIANLERRR